MFRYVCNILQSYWNLTPPTITDQTEAAQTQDKMKESVQFSDESVQFRKKSVQ